MSSSESRDDGPEISLGYGSSLFDCDPALNKLRSPRVGGSEFACFAVQTNQKANVAIVKILFDGASGFSFFGKYFEPSVRIGLGPLP